MADISNAPVLPRLGFLARFGLSARRWASTYVAPARQITAADAYMYGAGTTTIASLLGSGSRGVRARQIIYDKWSMMEGDPIISTAIMLLVTSALGGHETSGDLVFVEKKADAKKDKRLSAIVDDIAAELAPLFNKTAYQVAYIGGTFGDAYARLYTNARGVVDIHVDETMRPPMVQPFERGSRTVGFAVYTGERGFERLDVSQMARLKMPRVQWVPQYGVVEKALRLSITENDINKLPIMPSMVGGSLLYGAEGPYDNLTASLLGLVGQRWMDSIDEQMVAVNLESMNLEQQQRFVESVKSMLMASKNYAEQAVKTGRPVMERIRHIIPIFNEKQLTTVGPANGGQLGRAATISIEDVMLHARMLSGALGVDLSMLGFADQLSGGLGEGGFFRVSAQAAERARIIRVALAEFFNHIIDIHTMRRYGVVFDPKQRPWMINFFGSISALEAEKQRTRADSMNAGMLLAQSMQMMKELGSTKEVMAEFLAKTMMLDEDQAKLYATIVDAQPPQDGEAGGGEQGLGGAQMDSVLDVILDAAPKARLGPIFTEYENDPEGAIERLMRERTGDARAVWKRQGIGTIDLVWGNSKGGLMHIAQKHPEIVTRLPRILKTGKIYRIPEEKRKVLLLVDGTPPEIAVIALDWYGRAKTWVVTSYEVTQGKLAGRLKTVNSETLDSTRKDVLPEDQRTGDSLHHDEAL